MATVTSPCSQTWPACAHGTVATDSCTPTSVCPLSPSEGQKKEPLRNQGPSHDSHLRWKEATACKPEQSLEFALEGVISNLPLLSHGANYQRIHFKVNSEVKLQKLKQLAAQAGVSE